MNYMLLKTSVSLGVLTLWLGLAAPLHAQQDQETTPTSVSVSTKRAYLVLAFGNGVEDAAITSIPMLDLEQCEEQAALVLASERMKRKDHLGFECIEGR